MSSDEEGKGTWQYPLPGTPDGCDQCVNSGFICQWEEGGKGCVRCRIAHRGLQCTLLNDPPRSRDLSMPPYNTLLIAGSADDARAKWESLGRVSVYRGGGNADLRTTNPIGRDIPRALLGALSLPHNPGIITVPPPPKTKTKTSSPQKGPSPKKTPVVVSPSKKRRAVRPPSRSPSPPPTRRRRRTPSPSPPASDHSSAQSRSPSPQLLPLSQHKSPGKSKKDKGKGKAKATTDDEWDDFVRGSSPSPRRANPPARAPRPRSPFFPAIPTGPSAIASGSRSTGISPSYVGQLEAQLRNNTRSLADTQDRLETTQSQLNIANAQLASVMASLFQGVPALATGQGPAATSIAANAPLAAALLHRSRTADHGAAAAPAPAPVPAVAIAPQAAPPRDQPAAARPASPAQHVEQVPRRPASPERRASPPRPVAPARAAEGGPRERSPFQTAPRKIPRAPKRVQTELDLTGEENDGPAEGEEIEGEEQPEEGEDLRGFTMEDLESMGVQELYGLMAAGSLDEELGDRLLARRKEMGKKRKDGGGGEK